VKEVVRIAKWVAAILGGLIGLVLLTVLTITVFVDPNRFRGQIERAVTKQTGQPFDIKGDLHISWFPWLALRTGPSEFGKAEALPGQPTQPIVTWESARVGAQLVPLLKGQLIVDTIRLDGPKVRLVRHADGTSNWDAVVAGFRNRKPEPEPAPASGAEPAPPGPQVSGFQLRKGTLTYIDERPASAHTVTATDWSLDVGEWRAGSTFPVETQLSLAVDKALRANALKLSTRIHISDDSNDIDLFGLDFSSQIFAKPLPLKGLPLEFEVSRMALRLTPLDIGISELSSRVAGVQLITSIQAGEQGPDKTLYARGPIDLRVPSMRELLKALGLVDVPLPLDKGTMGALKLTSMMAWENGAITADAIDFTLDDTHFGGQASRTADASPVWTFALHGDKIALDRYLSLEDKSKQPFELPVKALKALQAQGELTFDQASLGETRMHGVKLRLELENGKVRTASR
jgi:AsmA protein